MPTQGKTDSDNQETKKPRRDKLPDLRDKDNPVLAILVADIHLSHRPPVARSEEVWYDVMERYLDQLTEIANVNGSPIICAGDVFDRWNSPPELINFAHKHMPKMYAIPGQHDLPLHRYEDMEKSAYWTLVKMGNIIDMRAMKPKQIGRVIAHPFPWGTPVKPLTYMRDKVVHLAVIHAYCWMGQHKYEGAGDEFAVPIWDKRLRGYNAAVFGDNHKGFLRKHDDVDIPIFNCGTFIRRRYDEQNYQPAVGILFSDGSIERYPLDTGEDVILKRDAITTEDGGNYNVEDIITLFEESGDSKLDFERFVDRWVDTRPALPYWVKVEMMKLVEEAKVVIERKLCRP